MNRSADMNGPADMLPRLGPTLADDERVGGKAANLGRLQRLGLDVPAGFVIPADWYRAHLTAAMRPMPMDTATVAARLQQMPLQAGLRAALKHALQDAGVDWPLAVRSSGLGEDGGTHSFAGQFDSVLGVHHPDALEDAIRQVWASAWSARCLAYTQARSLMPVTMAVIVQTQIAARWSGVLFTRDPVRDAGRTPRAADPHAEADAVLEIVPGLGDSLVGGAAEPWRYRIPADGPAVLESEPVPEAGDAKRCQPTAPDREPWFGELIRTGRRIEQQWGCPQDIEWSCDEAGRLWLLQSRPVTNGAPGDDREWWSNANVAENFPDPLTPFLFSIVRRGYAAYFRNLGLGFGISPTRVAAMAPRLERLVGLHGGRLYYNLSNIHAVLALAPNGAALAAWFNTFTGAQAFPDVPAVALGPFARRIEPARIAISTAACYLRIERRIRRFESTVNDYAQATTPDALAAADPTRLAGLIAAFIDIRTQRWNDAALADAAAMVTYGLLSRLMASLPLADDPTRLHALLKGLPGLASAGPVEALWALSRALRDDPALAARIESTEAGVLAAAWQRGELGAFGARFAAYLRDWGFRYSRELMLDSPTPDEDPAPMFELLKTYLRASGDDPATITGRQARDRIAVTADVMARLTPNRFWRRLPISRAGRFGLLLRAAQGSIRYRERARMKQALLYTRLRKVVLAAGRHLQERGWLEHVDDAFLMEPEALMRVLDRSAAAPVRPPQPTRSSDPTPPSHPACRSAPFDPALRLTITTARLLQHCHAAHAPPDTLVLPRSLAWTPAYRAPVADHDTDSGAGPDDDPAVLHGTSACGGNASGTAIVVNDVSGIDAIGSGQILVTRQTDPGWAAVFFMVGGLVIERGGMLSHGAIIAREYGIPAVIGVKDATTRIRSGQSLRVDGNRGLVQVGIGTTGER